MNVVVDDGSFLISVCEPLVADWLPTGQLSSWPEQLSCHVSVASSVSGLALSASAPVVLWNANGVAVTNFPPGGRVHSVCPTLQNAPPVAVKFSCERMFAAMSSPPAAWTTSRMPVIVKMSGSMLLATVKLHFVF